MAREARGVIDIRKAEWRDLPGIATLVRMHYDSTGFPQELSFDASILEASLMSMLVNPTNALLVATASGAGALGSEDRSPADGSRRGDSGEQVIGTIGMVLFNEFFTSELGARELFMFVRPEYRGQHAGVGMIRMAEDWASSNGASVIIIGNHPLSPPHVATTYKRHGYREAQTDFILR